MKRLIAMIAAGSFALLAAPAFSQSSSMDKGMSGDKMEKPMKKKTKAKKDKMQKDSMAKDSMAKDSMSKDSMGKDKMGK